MRNLALCPLLLVALATAPSAAHAHGRPPFIGELAFHPSDPDTIVARASWGLVITEDHGETWRWICAAVTGADPTIEDPPVLVMPDGAILVATFSGLSRSQPDRCEWSFPAEALSDVFVIDLDARPSEPGTVFAIATSGSSADELYRSTDMGLGFERLGAPIDEILLERVLAAPSDLTRVYLSGAIPTGAGVTERRGFFLRSSDDGASFEQIELTFEEGERNVHLMAIDPTDADRVLLRMTRRAIDTRPERLLLTEDGGDTFTTALMARDLSSAGFSADGASAWATSRTLEGLFRSDDAGRTFTQLVTGNMLFVGQRGDELWLAVDELRDGYAVGRSTDGGDTIEEILHFNEIYRLPDCPACSQVGYVCPEWFPDLAYDLGLDAGTAGGFDGGVTGAPRDAAPPVSCRDGSPPAMDGGVDGGPGSSGGCACRAGPARASRSTAARGGGTLALAVAALAVGASRRRRRRRGGSTLSRPSRPPRGPGARG